MKNLLIHPLTGEPIVPLGRRRDGRLIWPIMGAAEDGGGQGAGSGQGTSQGQTGGTGGTGGGEGQAGGDGGGQTDDRNDPNSPTAIETARKEREHRKQLEKELADMRSGQQSVTDMQAAVAKALGLTPEEQSDTDKLTEQIDQLKKQFADSQRQTTLLELAAEHKIPKDYLHLLTATDAEALIKQAEAVAELVKGKDDSNSGSARDAGIGAGGSNTPPDPGPGRNRMRHAIEASSKN